jgi:DNA-binding CsgD family transcriptional regulator/tetratricopeptide (TPR) repeat protein
MLTAVVMTLPRWPIVGRRPELELFERALGSGERAGLVIYGRAGVGKTRLADECAGQAAANGHPAQRVAGSRTTALLPLGAVAALLPDGLGRLGPDGQVNAVALFEQTRRALHDRHRGRRLVIVADDMALLDVASLALLGYLAAQRAIFLIATVRTGEPVPDLLTDLWRDGRLDRVDLHDLSRAQLDTLLHLALGGPIEAGAGREFWEASRGNPLYVHELALGALESGALVERSGVWHLEDHLPATGRLLDLVEQRIGGLPDEARSVVELLALCQPVELSYLETAAPDGVLESLERAGLVTIAVAEGQVRLAHPLHAKVVRAAMPKLRARAVLLAQAERLDAVSPAAGPAELRAAVWRLDAGGRPGPDVLIRGAHLARSTHDFRMVRRLMEAVPSEQLDAAGALLLGEALYELGAFDASERVLAHGQRLSSGEHVAMRLAVTRAKNAHWGLCQPGEALAINGAAKAMVSSPPLVAELVAHEAAVLTFSGRPDIALAVLEGITGSDQRARVVRAIAGAVALAMAGRTAEAVALAEVSYADHVALGDELAIAHPATHIVNQVFALTEAGRLAEAEQLARAGAEVVASHRVPIAQIWFAANLGRVATLQGRLATARRYYAEAAGLAQANHFAGPHCMALSGLALAHAMLGEPDSAAQALRDRAALPSFGFLGPEQHLADAWAAMAARHPAEAATAFRSAAAQAASTGHRLTESWLLHDLMRASGEDVSVRLRELAGVCDSPLVSARARHAAAVRARDAGELTGAADDFEALGAMLLAAEAAGGAAGAFSRAGDRRAATAALRRSSALAAACEGADTPGLFHLATVNATAADPLSGREREVVLLAATGMASKDIAERLYLSVRTVNNHLQHAYAKLGVTSRAGLAQALGSTI